MIYGAYIGVEPMRMALVPLYFSIRNHPNCYCYYPGLKPVSYRIAEEVLERDTSRPFWTGYALYDRKTCQFLGRGGISSGLTSREVQIGDVFYHPSRCREVIYQDIIETLLGIAQQFMYRGVFKDGQPIEKVGVSLIDHHYMPQNGIITEELEMRMRVCNRIFGAPEVDRHHHLDYGWRIPRNPP